MEYRKGAWTVSKAIAYCATVPDRSGPGHSWREFQRRFFMEYHLGTWIVSKAIAYCATVPDQSGLGPQLARVSTTFLHGISFGRVDLSVPSPVPADKHHMLTHHPDLGIKSVRTSLAGGFYYHMLVDNDSNLSIDTPEINYTAN